MKISVHAILDKSAANGPGLRNVVWLQGCGRNCAGCCNPGTHDPEKGFLIDTSVLSRRLLRGKPDGVTISGGEPFAQKEALRELLHSLHSEGRKPVLLFSGYELEELRSDSISAECLTLADALICGPYRQDLPPAYERFCASENQRLILLSNKYSPNDFANLPLEEYRLSFNGQLTGTGIFRFS